MARRVFITVAEVSGDRHAAQLVAALRQLDPDLVIEGLGGPEMAEAGAVIHRETVSNAAMGLRGALRAFEVRGLLGWTRRHFEQHRPDLLIGVDSPSMNFHFAKLAKRMGIPVMQYVAPQLWAWREGRMEKVRRLVDRLACVLPFEEKYFRDHGINATFVGHPLFDSLPERRDTTGDVRFPNRQPVIGLLPGSRKSEADANFRGLLGAARQIHEAFPGATFVVPTTQATDPVVSEQLRFANVKWVESGLDAFDEMVPRCDLCLTVSGTATLHVAGLGVPMIVVYHASRALWNLVGRWLIRVRTYALVNVLAGGPDAGKDEHVVPEIIPWFGDPSPVADMAIDYLRNPDKLVAQREALARLVAALDHPGASMNVAKMAMEMLNAAPVEGSTARLGSNPVPQV